MTGTVRVPSSIALVALLVVVTTSAPAVAVDPAGSDGSLADADHVTAAGAIDGDPVTLATYAFPGNWTAPNATDDGNETDTGLVDATDTTDTADATDATDAIAVAVETVDGAARNATGSAVDATGSLVNGSASVNVTADAGTLDGSVSAGVSADGTNVTVGGTAGVADGDAGTRREDGTNASAGGAADGGGGDQSTDGGGLPPAGGGAVAVGVGAVAAAALARRSATLAPHAPDAANALARLPSVAHLRAGRSGREWAWRLLGLFGYSRYAGSDPLEHDTRAALYDGIADAPGSYLSELSDRTDVPLSTVRHHLDVLEREGLVTSTPIRGKRRYFPLDAVGDEALLAALEDDASAAVVGCLAEIGPASVSAVADELDRDVSTVSHHLSRLAEDGLIERERDGRAVTNRLAPDVAEALARADEGRPTGAPPAGAVANQRTDTAASATGRQ